MKISKVKLSANFQNLIKNALYLFPDLTGGFNTFLTFNKTNCWLFMESTIQRQEITLHFNYKLNQEETKDSPEFYTVTTTDIIFEPGLATERLRRKSLLPILL
jgi:hypothetical protein